MIPLHDLERRTGTPLVTRAILLANVAVWLYVLSLLGRPAELRAFYDRWSFDPAELRATLAAGQATAATLAPLFTHQFLHGGWPHLAGNVLYLWVFGGSVEGRLGSAGYLLFYLASGAFAAIGQAVAAPAAMVGASGPIAGVLGAYVVLSPTARVRTLVFLGIFITVITLPAVVVIGEWIVIQVLSGLEVMRLTPHRATDQVAYAAHVAGFLSGIVLVRLLLPRR
ncbi:MAG: rhomboid family intramembrane serine protease [Chloroflexi bacterium]|nr:rhomboid family intramembrane serine protease [Chloroflexota bacterium]